MSYDRTRPSARGGGGGASTAISAAVNARVKTKTSSMSPAKLLATCPTTVCVDGRTDVIGFVVSCATRIPSTYSLTRPDRRAAAAWCHSPSLYARGLTVSVNTSGPMD